MSRKSLPFDEPALRSIAAKHPTPFHIYDEKGIRASAQGLNQAFDWSPGYINYFAVKANPNPYLLELLKSEGMGADASSLAELILADKVGLRGEQIMFTSNNTAAEEYHEAYRLGAVINLDDINQVGLLAEALDGKFPELISFRYNPGPDMATIEGNVIGNPSDAKFGVSTDQLLKAYEMARDKGAKRFGLHTMIVSNDRNPETHVQIAEMMFNLAIKLHRELGIKLEFINLGGGLGVAYHPDDEPLDLDKLKAGIQAKYQATITKAGLDPIKVVTENGRFVLAPNGYLVTSVRSLKNTYHNFVGLDATMADLMRPGMYGAYHHVSVPGKEAEAAVPQRLTGSLCENNDIFTGRDDRLLPKLEIGDLVVIHDTGAHGHAMGFNYNGKLRHAELLLQANGSVKQIRRAETLDDYFSTLDYPGL
jgi:diaminopimelate decarboxylase